MRINFQLFFLHFTISHHDYSPKDSSWQLGFSSIIYKTMNGAVNILLINLMINIKFYQNRLFTTVSRFRNF